MNAPAMKSAHWLILPSADQPGVKLSDKCDKAALAKADASRKPAERKAKPSKRAFMIEVLKFYVAGQHDDGGKLARKALRAI